jgi:hypothetical protein
MNLATYVRRRTGVPLGASGSLRNMLRRSLGAGTFAAFWRYWNPIWGYYLACYVHRPARRLLPESMAVWSTFVVSGLAHDLAASLVRREPVFVITQWFALVGLLVVATSAAGWRYHRLPWMGRAAVNTALVMTPLLLVLHLRGSLPG